MKSKLMHIPHFIWILRWKMKVILDKSCVFKVKVVVMEALFCHWIHVLFITDRKVKVPFWKSHWHTSLHFTLIKATIYLFDAFGELVHQNFDFYISYNMFYYIYTFVDFTKVRILQKIVLFQFLQRLHNVYAPSNL